jgi:DNA-binding response OmpR family regulator
VRPAAGRVTGMFRNIIIVEQDPWVNDMAKRVTSSLGYHPVLTSDAERAVELCKSAPNETCVLVTAVMLSGTNGLELAARLKKISPRLKVVYLSSREDAVQICGVVHSGSACLTKPFTQEQFAYALGVLLGPTTGRLGASRHGG